MKLSAEPFEKISSGAKVIESRLYDEKRQQVKIGDEIEFLANENADAKARVCVKGLLLYKSFKDLFADHDPSLFGEKSRDFLLKQIKQFYSDDDEEKYGVIGIRIELLDGTSKNL